MIADLHLLRPLWLLALVPAALLWWALLRRTDARRPWRGVVAPHLLPYLLSGEEEGARRGPLALVGVGWAVATLAVAGPSWRREPSPFADDVAALAIVVKVTPSMQAEDVQPSRLARAAQKVHDLLARRGGARTALVAYAGSAHVVMPATKDGAIIDTFAQALAPEVMPEDGDAAADALALADRALAGAGGGSILWIADGVAPENAAALARWRASSRTPVRLLPPLLPGPEMGALERAARPVDAGVVALSADDADVDSLAREARYAPSAAAPGEGERWEEGGWLLTPLLLALLLPFFRRGFMVPTGARA